MDNLDSCSRATGRVDVLIPVALVVLIVFRFPIRLEFGSVHTVHDYVSVGLRGAASAVAFARGLRVGFPFAIVQSGAPSTRLVTGLCLLGLQPWRVSMEGPGEREGREGRGGEGEGRGRGAGAPSGSRSFPPLVGLPGCVARLVPALLRCVCLPVADSCLTCTISPRLGSPLLSILSLLSSCILPWHAVPCLALPCLASPFFPLPSSFLSLSSSPPLSCSHHFYPDPPACQTSPCDATAPPTYEVTGEMWMRAKRLEQQLMKKQPQPEAWLIVCCCC